MSIHKKVIEAQHFLSVGERAIKQKPIKKCAYCGKEFVARHAARRYCLECFADPKLYEKIAKREVALLGLSTS